MQLLDMNETIEQLSSVISARWNGLALRRDKNNNQRRALSSGVKRTRRMGRPKIAWLRAGVRQSRNVGLSASDANNCSR